MSVPQNSKLSERLAVLATIAAQTVQGTSAGTVTSGVVNIASATGASGNYFSRFLVLANVANTNVSTVQLLSSTDSALGGVTVIASQTMSSATVPNCLMDLNGTTQICSDTASTYIALRIVTTNAGPMLCSGAIIGGDGRFDPASTYNATTVNGTIKSV